MTAEIVKTDWFSNIPPEGTVVFKGRNGGLISAYSYYQDFTIGKQTEIELSCISAELEFQNIFFGNQNKERKLVQMNDWEYEGYGQITSINPVKVDFGEFELQIGNWINDLALIGAFIYWKIDRLDIWKIN